MEAPGALSLPGVTCSGRRAGEHPPGNWLHRHGVPLADAEWDGGAGGVLRPQRLGQGRRDIVPSGGTLSNPEAGHRAEVRLRCPTEAAC